MWVLGHLAEQLLWVFTCSSEASRHLKILIFLKILTSIQVVNVPFFLVSNLINLQQEESGVGLGSGGNGQLLTLGLGLLATAIAATYVTRLAKVLTHTRTRLDTVLMHRTFEAENMLTDSSSIPCTIWIQDAIKDIEWRMEAKP